MVSAYLSAKLAKLMGIKTLILQNMLNTPRYMGDSGLSQVKSHVSTGQRLEDPGFRCCCNHELD